MISNKVTVTNTATALGDTQIDGPIMVRAKSTNSVDVYLGDLNVTTAAGFILEAGDALVLENVSNLEHLYSVCTTSGVISWIVLNV